MYHTGTYHIQYDAIFRIVHDSHGPKDLFDPQTLPVAPPFSLQSNTPIY